MKQEPISALSFERECQDNIVGWLWDESFNPEYQESISLTVAEMRYIANALRAKEGLPLNKVCPFTKGQDNAKE